MRPRERRETGEQDLFRSRLDQIIDMKHPLVTLARTVESAQERVDDQEKGRMVAVASELPTTGYALEWTISLLRRPLPGGICRPIGYGAPGVGPLLVALSPVRSDERHLSAAMADGTIAGSSPLLSWRVPAEMKCGSHRYGIPGVEGRSPQWAKIVCLVPRGDG